MGLILWIRTPYPRLVEGRQWFLVPPTLVGEVLAFVHFPVEKVHEVLQIFSGVCEPKVPQLWWRGPWRTFSREMIWVNVHLGKLASGGIWGTQVEAEVFFGDPQSDGSPGWWGWGRWWHRVALLVYGRWDRQNARTWMTLRRAEGNLPEFWMDEGPVCGLRRYKI